MPFSSLAHSRRVISVDRRAFVLLVVPALALIVTWHVSSAPLIVEVPGSAAAMAADDSSAPAGAVGGPVSAARTVLPALPCASGLRPVGVNETVLYCPSMLDLVRSGAAPAKGGIPDPVVWLLLAAALAAAAGVLSMPILAVGAAACVWLSHAAMNALVYSAVIAPPAGPRFLLWAGPGAASTWLRVATALTILSVAVLGALALLAHQVRSLHRSSLARAASVAAQGARGPARSGARSLSA